MSRKRKINSYKVEINDNTLEQYERMLSKFYNWNQIKREIKITNLLENKKIQFNINLTSNANKMLFVEVLDDFENTNLDISLQRVCANIKSMKFILESNKVLDLELSFDLMTTEWGKIVREIIDSGVELPIYQKKFDGQIFGFYFSYPKSVA